MFDIHLCALSMLCLLSRRLCISDDVCVVYVHDRSQCLSTVQSSLSICMSTF